jgi:hypothetical protein
MEKLDWRVRIVPEPDNPHGNVDGIAMKTTRQNYSKCSKINGKVSPRISSKSWCNLCPNGVPM